MKTKHEPTIQFSGYPLKVAEIKQPIKKIEVLVSCSLPNLQIPFSKNSPSNDPGNWDVDWFNSYE